MAVARQGNCQVDFTCLTCNSVDSCYSIDSVLISKHTDQQLSCTSHYTEAFGMLAWRFTMFQITSGRVRAAAV